MVHGAFRAMSNFRFRWYQRRIARAVFSSMVPRWSNFDRDLTDDTLDGVETLVRGYPRITQTGIALMLYFLEFGGPLTFTGILPFSWLDKEAAKKRLERWFNHPIHHLRHIPRFLNILVCLNAYSRPDVESHLGVDRRRWRENRRRFRQGLVQLDAARELPATPAALEAPHLADPRDYLAFDDTIARTNESHP